jgi:hypothetical protein
MPSMRDGLLLAGYSEIDDVSLTFAFYGDLFRPPADFLGSKTKGRLPRGATRDPATFGQAETRRSQHQSNYTTDHSVSLERDLLKAWYQHSAELDPKKSTRRASPKLPSRPFLTAIYKWMFGSGILAESIGERSLFGDARKMSIYMQDQVLREEAWERLVAAIDSDTRVIVGHSLGAVVAYETLCLHPELPATTLVTLGAPLGIRNLIFDRLEPEPENTVGKWPGSIKFWDNIVDPRDILALGKPLRPLFGPRVNDHFVDNGSMPHSVTRYLSSASTGQAIISGLQD